MDNTVWDRIKAAINAKPQGKDREVSWLAEKLGTKIQNVENWTTRGVPPRKYPEIAVVLGWTVGAVAGTEDPPMEVWPFETVSREEFERLSTMQRGWVESAMFDAMTKVKSAAEQLSPAPPSEKQRARK